MTEQVVPTERTPVDLTALYLALRVASIDQVGYALPRRSLLVIMAQSCLETANGLRSNNWNLGGIKHVPGDGHSYTTYLTREVVNGQSITLTQQFRAYDSLADGAADYLHLLRTTFGYAWPAIEAGDTADYAHRLRARGYFTAPEQEYAAGLAARYAMLDAKVPPDTLPELPQSQLDAVRTEAINATMADAYEPPDPDDAA